MKRAWKTIYQFSSIRLLDEQLSFMRKLSISFWITNCFESGEIKERREGDKQQQQQLRLAHYKGQRIKNVLRAAT